MIDYINNESHSNTNKFISKDIKKDKQEIEQHRDEINSPSSISKTEKRQGRSLKKKDSKETIQIELIYIWVKKEMLVEEV